MVFFKVSPSKGIFRFEKRGKLSSRYIGPFEILERIEHIVYKLALPPQPSNVHNMFHVSLLCKCIPNPSHQISYTDLQIHEKLNYQELPIRIVNEQIR